MTKKKRHGSKKTKAQVKESLKKQRLSAHTRMFNELYEPLAKMREVAEDLGSILPRFKRLSIESRRALYDMIAEADDKLSPILDLYYDATASEKRTNRDSPINRDVIGALGIAGMIAGMFGKALDNAIKRDEFPDSIDVDSIDIEGRRVDPEPKLLIPGEKHDD
jgi:hypothetical protein